MGETEAAYEPKKIISKTATVYFPGSRKKSQSWTTLYFLSGCRGETGEGVGHLRRQRRARSPLRSDWAYSQLEPNSGTSARLSSGSAVPLLRQQRDRGSPRLRGRRPKWLFMKAATVAARRLLREGKREPRETQTARRNLQSPEPTDLSSCSPRRSDISRRCRESLPVDQEGSQGARGAAAQTADHFLVWQPPKQHVDECCFINVTYSPAALHPHPVSFQNSFHV